MQHLEYLSLAGALQESLAKEAGQGRHAKNSCDSNIGCRAGAVLGLQHLSGSQLCCGLHVFQQLRQAFNLLQLVSNFGEAL